MLRISLGTRIHSRLGKRCLRIGYYAILLALTSPILNATDLQLPLSNNSPYICVYKSPVDLRIAMANKKKLIGKKDWTLKALKKEGKNTDKLIKSSSLSQQAELKIKSKSIKGLIKKINACPAYNPPSASFDDVKQILETNCMGCHMAQGSWHNTQEWYLSAGRVAPGDAEASILYRYLKNNPQGYLPSTMPKGLSAISAAQINIIRAWINSIGPTDGNLNIPPAYSCDTSQPPSTAPLLRMSKTEYVNSVSNLLTVFPAGDQSTILNEISSAFALFPADTAQKSFLSEQVFSNNDNRLLQEHIDGAFHVAQSFANSVSANPTRIMEFSEGNCIPGPTGTDLTCLRNLIAGFGKRVYRRPLVQAEKTALENFFISRPIASALPDLVLRMMLSPQFLYHVEVDGTPLTPGSDTLQLSPYELAARLAFQFWQSAPSDALLTAAANGSLSANYDQVVNNTFFTEPGLSRTKATFENFFSEWFGLDHMPAINSGNTPAFTTFAAGENIPVGGTELKIDSIEEILDLVNYYTWTANSSLDQLFLGNLSMTTSAALAHLYGVTPRQPGAAPIALASERLGPLSRAALLISGDHRTNPAKRGARIMRDIMCVDLPDPDPTTMGQVITPPYNPQLTTRQRFMQTTAQPACVGCHAKINPIGFALESFDALGRKRTVERVISPSGTLDATLPINTHAIAPLMPGQLTEIADGADLISKITDQGIVHACITKKYVEFSLRRHADLNQDGCMLEALRQTVITPGAPLKDLFRSIVNQPAFNQHRIGN